MFIRSRQTIPRIIAICIGATFALLTSLPNEVQNVTDIELDITVDEPPHLEHEKSNDLMNKVMDEQQNPKEDNKFEVEKKYKAPDEKSNEVHVVVKNQTSSKNIINEYNYKYIHSPSDFCKKSPLVVIFVHSAIKHMKRREQIRQTWGNTSYHFGGQLRFVFVVANSNDPAFRQSIKIEHKIHDDILLEDFIDDYKNITYKVTGALKWILNTCKDTPFVVKTDDDTFVNIFSLMKHLTDLKATNQVSDLFLCRLMGKMPVLRKGKWLVTRDEYPDDYYPPYCSGLALIMTMDIAKTLYQTALITPLMWVDDAWFSGVVGKKAGITHTNINKVYLLDKARALEKLLGDEWYQYLFAHVGPKAFVELWAGLLKLAETPNPKFKLKSEQVYPGVVVT